LRGPPRSPYPAARAYHAHAGIARAVQPKQPQFAAQRWRPAKGC